MAKPEELRITNTLPHCSFDDAASTISSISDFDEISTKQRIWTTPVNEMSTEMTTSIARNDDDLLSSKVLPNETKCSMLNKKPALRNTSDSSTSPKSTKCTCDTASPLLSPTDSVEASRLSSLNRPLPTTNGHNLLGFINNLVNIVEEIDHMDVSDLMLNTNEKEFIRILMDGKSCAQTHHSSVLNSPNRGGEFLPHSFGTEATSSADLVDFQNNLSVSFRSPGGRFPGEVVNKFTDNMKAGDSTLYYAESQVKGVPSSVVRRHQCGNRFLLKTKEKAETPIPMPRALKRRQTGGDPVLALPQAVSVISPDLIPPKRRRLGQINLSEVTPLKGELHWHFWVPCRQVSVFHSKNDRRMQSIARNSNSTIYLTAERKKGLFGDWQQLAVIVAQSNFCLSKCKNLIDEKFPTFRVKWGTLRRPEPVQC
uniref:SANTA domain-containing protein n=1 Tax=Mesocestoides corti TaxID=53468 RepID=A0A5K3FLR2_MESCO